MALELKTVAFDHNTGFFTKTAIRDNITSYSLTPPGSRSSLLKLGGGHDFGGMGAKVGNHQHVPCVRSNCCPAAHARTTALAPITSWDQVLQTAPWPVVVMPQEGGIGG